MTQSVKNLSAMQETWVGPLGREDPLEKEMATHSCGHRSLAGYSPWGCKEMDMTGQLTHTHTQFLRRTLLLNMNKKQDHGNKRIILKKERVAFF